MSALAKIAGGYTVSYIPPQWSRDFEVHTSRPTSGPPLPGPHGEPAQRSLSLFRVVRLSFSVSAAPYIRGGSIPPDTQSMPTVSEHPTITAVAQIARVVAKVTAVRPARPGRWTEANVSLLRSDYPTPRPVRDISTEIGRSGSATYAKARRLKLKRPQRGTTPAPSAVPPPLPDIFMELVLPVTDSTPPVAESAPEPPPLEVTLAPPPKQAVKRTKLGGREGRWVRNDGALSVRLERLHLAGFHDRIIAAVLGLTSAAVLTRAWAISCPDRDVTSLRHDVEAARLIDRQAAPLPKTVISLDGKTTLTRKRCNLKGDFFWGDSKRRFCNDARRLPYFAALSASAPMHAC